MFQINCTTIFIVFLILKLTNVIDWSWWWVTAPLWGCLFEGWNYYDELKNTDKKADQVIQAYKEGMEKGVSMTLEKFNIKDADIHL